MQFYKNPFYLYLITFFVIILVYQLGWSTLYPDLSLGLIVFFVLSFLIALFCGGMIDKFNPIEFKKIGINDKIKRNVRIIYIFYALEFIYNKGIPIIMVLKASGYDYKLFGIPSLHPILTTFTSFYAAYVFHVAFSTRSPKMFLNLFWLMLIPVLIYNRGMLIIMMVSFLFIFLMSIKKIKPKALIVIVTSAIVLFYGFGVLGNYRTVKKNSSEYILEIGKASDSFKESSVPKEFIWSYLYISSPLANLQNNINQNPPLNSSIKSWMVYEMTPDFLSKRISRVVGATPIEKTLIAHWLTVGTVYSGSYVALGWPGLVLMFVFLISFTVFYLLVLKKSSDYYITGIAILNTFIVFNAFDNMIYFSGISFQLVFPLIFMYVKFPKFKLNGKSDDAN